MKIKTLGTSHGDPTKTRFNSSNIVSESGNHYVIDAGVPVDALLIREGVELSKIKAIFITHAHIDHIGGLPNLIYEFIKYPTPGHRTEIYLPEDIFSSLKPWLDAMHFDGFGARYDNIGDYMSFHVVSEGLIYEDEAVKVYAYGTKHIESENAVISYAYLFETKNRRMLYSGDLCDDFRDFPVRAFDKPIDLCVCECTHYSAESALPILKPLPLKKLLFNHVYHPWEDRLGELDLINLCKELPCTCCVAHDGEEFFV